MTAEMVISLLLDETGSMLGYKASTLSAVNEYIQSLQNNDNTKDGKFALTKFNSERTVVVCDGKPIMKVHPITDAEYQPDATTPLYDAIGKTIHTLEGKQDANVLMVIMTDGLENASKEFTREMIFGLIEAKKKLGWTFVFLGANIDSYAVSQSIGIPKGNTANYMQGRENNIMQKVTSSSIGYASRGAVQTDNFFDDQDDDKSWSPKQ